MPHEQRYATDWMGPGSAQGVRNVPEAVRDRVNTALTIAAEGGKAGIATPLRDLGAGVMEIAVRYRTDACRIVYVTEVAGTLWAIHAFQKKSKTGIKTPKAEIELVRARLGRLRREMTQ